MPMETFLCTLHASKAYNVMSYIIERSTHQLTELNSEGKLPIELLLYEAEYNRDSLEYVQAVNELLRANPESLAHLLVYKSQSGKESDPNTLKRKHPS
jgi:hypothetical protein